MSYAKLDTNYSSTKENTFIRGDIQLQIQQKNRTNYSPVEKRKDMHSPFTSRSSTRATEQQMFSDRTQIQEPVFTINNANVKQNCGCNNKRKDKYKKNQEH